MKKENFIISILILLTISCCCFSFSCLNRSTNKGIENLKNINQVEIGMDTTQVITFMGEPVQKRHFKDNLYFDYDIPDGNSGQLTITFDTLGHVIDKGNIP